MTETNKSMMLKSHSQELVKQYVTYDGSSRQEYVYTAKADAITGSVCIVTQYVYDGVTTRIVKRKESEGTWDSSYDI